MTGKLTRTTLEALNPAVLGQIAKGMRATAQEYETEQSRFPERLRHPGGGDEWTGRASDALQEHGALPAGRTYGSLREHLNDTATQAVEGEGLVSSSRDTARQFIAGVEAKFGANDPRVTFTAAAAVKDADLVQENGPERLNIKQDIFSKAFKAAPRHAVFATSSSSITASLIGKGLDDPSRLVVGHPFNPPALIRAPSFVQP